jgi:hypothetical protein
MEPRYISIPYAVDLSEEKSWQVVPNQKYAYCILRLHFLIRQRQASRDTKHGEIIATVEAPASTGSVWTYGEEIETEISRVDETIEQILVEEESIQTEIAELVTKLKVPGFGEASSGLKSEMSKRFKESITVTSRQQKSVTHRDKVKFEIAFHIPDATSETYYAVKAYKRVAYDIFLSYVDYLFVAYERRLFGILKKRRKSPELTGRNHTNWVTIKKSIAAIEFWMLLPKGGVVLSKKRYQEEVKDPFEIEVKRLEGFSAKHMPKPDVPTLYQLSTAAFPLRWVKRKGPWTEEELRKIEEEESGWRLLGLKPPWS